MNEFTLTNNVSITRNGEVLWKDKEMTHTEGVTPCNINQLIIGGTGTGKTYNCIKPQIKDCNGNYIICSEQYDNGYRTYFESKGYTVISCEFNGNFEEQKINYLVREVKNKNNIAILINFTDAIVYNEFQPMTNLLNLLFEGLCDKHRYKGKSFVSVIMDEVNVRIPALPSALKNAYRNNVRFVMTFQTIEQLVNFYSFVELTEMLSNIGIKMFLSGNKNLYDVKYINTFCKLSRADIERLYYLAEKGLCYIKIESFFENICELYKYSENEAVPQIV